jgi:general secretion pathway protein E
MAQRLVRRLDDSSKQPYQPDESLKAILKSVIDRLPQSIQKPDINHITLYKPTKTESNPFGYRGQIAIREQLVMSSSVTQLLKLPPNQISTEMIERAAVEEGMVTMLQDGVLKAISGLTSLEEIYRVVG